MKNIREDFQEEVERFLTDFQMSPTAFGLAAVKDPNFVTRVRNNRNFRLGTIERVLAYMSKQREAA